MSKLKILILGRTLSDILASASYHLYRAVNDSPYTECRFYGEGFAAEKGLDVISPVENDDVLKMIEIWKPDAIWVQWFFPSKGNHGGWKHLARVPIEIPKIAQGGDPWSNLHLKSKFAHQNCDAIILDSGLPDCPVWAGHWKGFPATLFHAGINTKVFYDMKLERTYDVGRFGAINPTYYPVRNFMHNALKRNKRFMNVITPERGHPPVDTAEGYAKTMNQCKMTLCTGEMYQVTGTRIDLLTHKYLEAMACKSLCVGPLPVDAPELHFINKLNIIHVTLRDFMRKIRYYLDNPEERKAIAQNGFDYIQKYHTIERRAAKFVELCRLLIANEEIPAVMS